MPSILQFIEARHQKIDLDIAGTYLMIGSKTRFTRMMNSRLDKAPLIDILRLSLRLQIHPLTLIEEYNMGASTISDEDRKQLKDHYSTKPLFSNYQNHNDISKFNPQNEI